jgi:4-hydroxy-tetrahydrodipicolinate synthase
MERVIFSGVCTALATPFTQSGLDAGAMEKLVETQLEAGVDALLACGTTGEPSTMTPDEWKQTVTCVIRIVRGRVPVLVGTGGNNTAEVIEKARIAGDLGADAQLCVTPYYNKTTQRGLIAHYTAIAENTDLPIIIYNVPSRTGLNILPETIKALSVSHKIIAVKEASGNPVQTGDILRMCGEMAVYSGCDELTVPLLSLGASGVISVASNIIPVYMRTMTHAFLSGDLKKAAEMQRNVLPLIKALFCEVSPIPLKAAMAMMGICKGIVRLPLIEMEDGNAKLLEKELAVMGLIKA